MHPTLAILGAGQLGRMLGLAAARMGVRCRFLDPAAASPEGCPAAAVGEVIAAEFTDLGALERLAAGADAVTYEFENVPVEAVEYLAARTRVWPPPLALRTAQDRLLEKQAFAACGAPTNATEAWGPATQSLDDLHAILDRLGLPVVLKTRRLGYDGKGQAVVRDGAGVDAALAALPRAPLLVEAFVPFQRELSIIGVRGGGAHGGGVRGGGGEQFRAYPLVQNVHRDGILRTSIAPAPGTAGAAAGARVDLQAQAESYIRALMDHFQYVGVMALELFEVDGPDGPGLLANEIAPRVHNTGHWTIEGTRTSQFENHVRAVLGWPLGDCAAVGHAAMINLIGVNPHPGAIMAIPGATYHWYGKTVRPGRKVGHVTVWGEDAGEVAARAVQVARLTG